MPASSADHAAYLQSWLAVLKEDKRTIFSAVLHARKAADYLRRPRSAGGQVSGCPSGGKKCGADGTHPRRCRAMPPDFRRRPGGRRRRAARAEAGKGQIAEAHNFTRPALPARMHRLGVTLTHEHHMLRQGSGHLPRSGKWRRGTDAAG